MPGAYDLIVIGSGPAGSAAAMTAAGLGLSVALVDRASFPRDKLCGGAVSGRAARYLRDVFGAMPAEVGFATTGAVRLSASGVTLGLLNDAPALHLTMRREFDAALHARAVEAGCAVFAPAAIAGLDLERPSVQLRDGPRIAGRCLLGADGVNSMVARALFGRAFDARSIGFALEAELPRGVVEGDLVEIDLAAADWGYGWVFPKRETVTLGVGGIHADNPDMMACFRAYLARHAPHLAATRCKGAFLPSGDFRRVPGRGRVLLAGDAAGFADPMTGEGIAWALKSGQLAAEACASALDSGGPDTALPRYRTALSFLFGELSRARRLRAVVYARPLRDLFTRMIALNPRLQRRYLEILAGEMDYADMSAAALPKIAMRMATAALR